MPNPLTIAIVAVFVLAFVLAALRILGVIGPKKKEPVHIGPDPDADPHRPLRRADAVAEPASETEGDDDDQQDTGAEEDEVQDDDTRTWQQKLTEADRLFAENKFDEAADLYNEVLDDADLLDDDIALAPVWHHLGICEQALLEDDNSYDDENDGSISYARALSIMEQAWGPFDPRLAPVLRCLLSFYSQDNQLDEAEQIAWRIRDLEAYPCTEAGGLEANTTGLLAAATSAATSIATGDESRKGNELDEAITAYEEALESAREQLGRNHLALTAILIKIGQAYHARDYGDYNDESVPNHYLRALGIGEQHLGPFHADLKPALFNLIAFFDEVGEHSKASRLVSRVREINQRAAQTAKAPVS